MDLLGGLFRFSASHWPPERLNMFQFPLCCSIPNVLDGPYIALNFMKQIMYTAAVLLHLQCSEHLVPLKVMPSILYCLFYYFAKYYVFWTNSKTITVFFKGFDWIWSHRIVVAFWIQSCNTEIAIFVLQLRVHNMWYPKVIKI